MIYFNVLICEYLDNRETLQSLYQMIYLIIGMVFSP